MKIAYLIDTIATDTAGTQKQLLETIRRLDRTQFEPELLCLWESPWMRQNRLPCPVTVLGYRGFLKADLPAVVRRLAAWIDARQVRILQTFFEDSIFVAALGAAFSRTRPVLLSSRRDIGLGNSNQPWYHRLFGAALPTVNRRFRGIVANCEQVRQYVARRERTPLEKIKVIYNGVALPSSSAPPAPGIFGEFQPQAWIGIAASLTPVKRHDLLIRGFATLVSRDDPQAPRLVLLGDGPERVTLESLATQLGVREFVHFEGAVAHVSAYLSHLDVAVLCSDREGLSNAILEYMSHGLPVVATAVGGNPELVTADTGILVPPADAAALGKALALLVPDAALRSGLGAAGLQRIQRDFSWERSMADLQAYYRDVAGRPAAL